MSNSDIGSKLYKISIENAIAVIHPLDRAFLHAQAKEFKRLLVDLRATGVAATILVLSLCDYISSEGISSITQGWKWCTEEGNGVLAVVVQNDATSEVWNLFEIIGISRILGSSLQPTLAAAIAHVSAIIPARQ